MPVHIARSRRVPDPSSSRAQNLSTVGDAAQSIDEARVIQKTAPRVIAHQAVTALIGNARNARTHDDKQIAQIAASIQKFGFTSPILIDDTGMVLAGHARLAAARRLGLQTVPTIALPGLSDAEKRAYALADNRLAEKAGWDVQIL